jgi:hypothetical protein
MALKRGLFFIYLAASAFCSPLTATSDLFPYKIDLSLSTEHKKQLSTIDFHANQLFPIEFKNKARAGLTAFDQNIGYALSYEQDYSDGTVSFSTGEQFLFNGLPLNNSFVYPSVTFIGGTWQAFQLKHWLLDEDNFSLISFNDAVWVTHFKQVSQDNINELNTISLGGKAHLESLRLDVLAQFHSSHLKADNSDYTGITTKVNFTSPTLNLIQDLNVSPRLSYTRIENSIQEQSQFTPNNSQFTSSSFYKDLNDASFSSSVGLFSTAFIFTLDDRIIPYVKSNSFSNATSLSAGILYQWRETVGFQIEAEHNSIEDGMGIWVRCILLDQLII